MRFGAGLTARPRRHRASAPADDAPRSRRPGADQRQGGIRRGARPGHLHFNIHGHPVDRNRQRFRFALGGYHQAIDQDVGCNDTIQGFHVRPVYEAACHQ